MKETEDREQERKKRTRARETQWMKQDGELSYGEEYKDKLKRRVCVRVCVSMCVKVTEERKMEKGEKREK